MKVIEPEPTVQLLRPAKFCKLIDVTRSKVYEMISKGQLRTVNIAGVLRIPIDEIDRLKASATARE
jgi:excisionase family DNA binding protein